MHGESQFVRLAYSYCEGQSIYFFTVTFLSLTLLELVSVLPHKTGNHGKLSDLPENGKLSVMRNTTGYAPLQGQSRKNQFGLEYSFF